MKGGWERGREGGREEGQEGGRQAGREGWERPSSSRIGISKTATISYLDFLSTVVAYITRYRSS